MEADLIILASPVYVYHVTGAMKALLDHYGYMWMAHRPEEAMFKKTGTLRFYCCGRRYEINK